MHVATVHVAQMYYWALFLLPVLGPSNLIGTVVLGVKRRTCVARELQGCAIPTWWR